MQVDPVKSKLEPPGTKRLEPEYNGLLSNFALTFNLRRCTEDGAEGGSRDGGGSGGGGGGAVLHFPISPIRHRSNPDLTLHQHSPPTYSPQQQQQRRRRRQRRRREAATVNMTKLQFVEVSALAAPPSTSTPATPVRRCRLTL